MARAKNGLTDLQDMFALYYAQYRNGHKAAIKAGYKPRSADMTASRMIRNDKVKKAIDNYINKAKTKSVASNHEVMMFFTNTMRAKTDEHVVGSGVDGQFDITKPPDIKDRIKAAEDLLKHNNPITVIEYRRAKANLEKVKAEAEIKKYEAKQNNSAQNKTINQTTKLLNKLEKATKK